MNVWTTIKLELYCGYSYMSRPTMKVCEIDDDFNCINPKTIKNCMYIKCKRPEWCRKRFKGKTTRIPNYDCLANPNLKDGVCPFLSYCEYDEKEED
jgi:hypothetical protein